MYLGLINQSIYRRHVENLSAVTAEIIVWSSDHSVITVSSMVKSHSKKLLLDQEREKN